MRARAQDARRLVQLIADTSDAAAWSIEPAETTVQLSKSLRGLLGVRSGRLGVAAFCAALSDTDGDARRFSDAIQSLRDGRAVSASLDHQPAAAMRQAVRFQTHLRSSPRGRGRFAVLGLCRAVPIADAIDEPARQSIERTSRTLKRSPGIAALFDRDGRILSASAAWERACGMSGKDYPGHRLQDMVPGLAAEVVAFHRRAQLGEHLLHESENYLGDDGRQRWLHCEYRPYTDVNGQVELYSVNAVDITEVFETRHAAQVSARRLEHALDAARVGVLEIDLVRQDIWCSREVEEILGQAPVFTAPDAGPWPMCHPDDRARLEHHIQSSATSRIESIEFRIVRPAGEIRWVEIHYKLEHDTSGRPSQVIVLLVDIDARKRQELALLDAQRASQAAAEAKSQFLANMSHELRTPMNGVLGVLHLLGSEALSEGGRRLLAEAEGCGRLLSQLLNDVVDLSKVEAGKLELSPEPMDAVDVLQSVVRLLRPQAEAKGVELRTRVTCEDAAILADSVRLQQVLFNLVGNAIKFTERGHVEVRLHIRDEDGGALRLRIEVEDTGVGVPEGVRSTLFQRFEQGDSSTARRFGGSGLGLAITRALAELMGGTVACESVEGEGSTFRFDVPVTAAARPAHEAVEIGVSIAGMKILVVEDNPTNQLVITTMLSAMGATVETANDGVDGLTLVQTRPFDLVLMDVQMPRMDGVEATRRIRALDTPAASTLIIGLTANVLDHQRQAYLAAGMNGVAAKPISLPALVAEIARLCGPGEDSAAA